ncbi:hypothetical protein FA15DRAFT_620591 [Coprinopsis marcescibilis]|uniref:BHLH domain-containing protein n=1 Tax=Coprinopsis marcescibilis TaxID=230819 RepID=A0A5C3KTN7_COPMA|nr:hypothetical protein FA15DRAFT_620591 [Coprinopsis marcescibilis]
METLLTPAESLALQSFLTSVDPSQPPPDWATYASQFAPDSLRRDPDDMPMDMSVSHDNDLTKATKDLMSLDNAWLDHGMIMDHNPQQHQQHTNVYNHLGHMQFANHGLHLSPGPAQLSRFPTAHEPFPFLNNKSSLPQTLPYPYQQSFLPDRIHHQPNAHHSQEFQSLPQLNGGSDSAFTAFGNPHPQPHHPQPPLTHSHSQSSATSSAPAKRPIRPSSATSGASSSSTPPPSANGQPPPTNKRAIASHARSSSQPTPSSNPSKPALLSPSQKKANHIQSEQKRRANIRRGYEALCDTVPALREAIREEEEEARVAAFTGASGMPNGKGKATSKKRTKKKDGDGESARDKIDGRAGPRSENVVLSKTIDYINELLCEKAALAERLQRGRAMLPPGHPVQTPPSNPLWEREWKGGEGKGDVEGEDEDSDEGDDNEEDGSSQTNKTSEKGSRRKDKGAEQ